MDLVSSPGRPGFIGVAQEAEGVIAIGQTAVGFIAIGQQARGVIAIGQMAIGVVAIGQLAIGAIFATGMVGLAGPYGYGLVLHTIPRIFFEKNPEVHDPSPVERLEDGALKIGHLGATFVDGELVFDATQLVVDTSAVRKAITEARERGFDRMMVTVDTIEEHHATGYRETTTTRRFVARSATGYWSTPPKRLAYAKPLGGGGSEAVRTHIALRTACALVLFAIVGAFGIAPLVELFFL